MSSTVTVSTVSTVATTLFFTSFGFIIAMTLFLLLVKKEILTASSNPLAIKLRRVLNVVIVPLSLAFVVIAIANILIEAFK